MNISEAAVLFIALAVTTGIVYFVVLPSIQSDSESAAPALFIEAPSTTLPNQPVHVTIAAKFAAGKTIYVSSEGESRALSCDTSPCVFSTTFTYPQPGEKKIIAQLNTISETRVINVTAVAKRCIDGTIDGTCSRPPFMCENAQLISNCSICGCPNGDECISGACTKPPLTFSISRVEVPATVYSTAAANVHYSIQNTSAFDADGLFLLVAQSYSASEQLLDERAQQIQLSDLAPGATHAGSLDILFPAHTTSMRLRLYDNPAAYPSSTLLSESARSTVRVSIDTTPPLPPTQLSSTSTATETILAWQASASGDVVKYIIYQENFSNGGFTTYSTAGETASTTFSIARTPTPLAYVVRAIDGAGNQSDPTSPLVVSS